MALNLGPLVIIKVTSVYTDSGDDWPGTCQSGKEQSPIDFPDRTSAILSSGMPKTSQQLYQRPHLGPSSPVGDGLSDNCDTYGRRRHAEQASQ